MFLGGKSLRRLIYRHRFERSKEREKEMDRGWAIRGSKYVDSVGFAGFATLPRGTARSIEIREASHSEREYSAIDQCAKQGNFLGRQTVDRRDFVDIPKRSC